MNSLGRFLIVTGILFIIAGLIAVLRPKTGFPGRLPGDLFVQKENFTFYFPITTSIVVSLILSLVFYFISRK